MTQILPRPATSLARPANLLLLALLPLVAFMALAHVTVVGGSAVEMTAAQVPGNRATGWAGLEDWPMVKLPAWLPSSHGVAI
jgi:hypothetical protein